MSGISTTAIKDGHEGTRPNADGTSGVDRINRLGLGMGYFDQPPIPRSNSYTSTPGQSTPGAYTPGTGEKRGSPASSTVTTDSTLQATREAKLIDGMTYDEGVVDTTDRSPMLVLNKEKEGDWRRKRAPGMARKEGDEQTEEIHMEERTKL